jgi:ribonuclease HI
VNLHCARAAAANISHLIAREGIGIGLIQEPWAPKEEVLGINLKGHKVIWCKNEGRPRAALVIDNNIKHVCLSEFLTRDLVPLEANILVGGIFKKVVLASAYFAGDREAPPLEVRNLAQHCKRNNIPLLIGSDANAHSECWGSSDTNKRGESVLEFLTEVELTSYNIGNRPTFETVNRQEVLDVTFGSYFWCGLISKWRVSPEPSLSDHKIILFDLKGSTLQQVPKRNPRGTDWESYGRHASSNLGNVARQGMISGMELLNHHVNEVNTCIVEAFHSSCKLTAGKAPRSTPWWNDHLEDLKRRTRRAANARKRKGDSGEYAKILTEYSKEIRKAKRAHYRKFCEEIESTPTAARLHKALGKDKGSTISTIRKPDGTYTEDEEERAKLLLKTHFPGSTPIREGEVTLNERIAVRSDWQKAKEIITHEKVKWAIGSFSPYKSPGLDGIFPCLLQKAPTVLMGYLLDIFRSSLATGLIPEAWKSARVVFMPKAGKKDSTHPKSFRPISLTPFTLKAMEKIVDNHIRNNILTVKPLHFSQHAYLEGRSTETALYQFVSQISQTLENKEVCMSLFLDMEGAFDNTSHSAIEEVLTKRDVDTPIIKWIMALLRSRKAIMEVGDSHIGTQTTRGCPQGGVLSPLLWSLVIDDLLQELAKEKIDCQGYADDVVLYVRGKTSIHTMCERIQQGINICKRWCTKVGLKLNPDKTGIVNFTRKIKLPGWKPIKLGDTEIKVHKHFKYLGVILDDRLTWNQHLEEAYAKATKALMVCNRLVGKNWGCNPKITHWIYTAIVRPRLTYGAIAWADKLEEGKARQKVEKVQRLACLTITSAMRTSPTRALEVITGLTPVHLHVKEQAMRSLVKFTTEGFGPHSILRSKDKEGVIGMIPILELPTDTTKKKFVFERNYKTELSTKANWESVQETHKISRGTLVWYTDGSKMKQGTGAGVFGPGTKYTEIMGNFPNICQAEMHAIERCAAINLKRGYVNRKIAILSDSQAAIRALSAYTVTSKLAWDCITRLNELGSRNQVTIYWVPGHRNIYGNEVADELARKGSEQPFTGPEPFCGINTRIAEELIRESFRKEWENLWLNNSGCRQAKNLLGKPNNKKSSDMLCLPRKQLRILTAFLTGHCKLGKHLTTMGLQEDSKCRFCKIGDETPTHLLINCYALMQSRHRALGHRVLTPKMVRTLHPNAILAFLKRTGLIAVL